MKGYKPLHVEPEHTVKKAKTLTALLHKLVSTTVNNAEERHSTSTNASSLPVSTSSKPSASSLASSRSSSAAVNTKTSQRHVSHRPSPRAKQLLTANAIFTHLAPLLTSEYIVADCLLELLCSVTEHVNWRGKQERVHALLEYMWCTMEEHELKPCLEHLIVALQNAYRFSAAQPGFVNEVRRTS